MKPLIFNSGQMEIVNTSAEQAEEIVSGHYKMSVSQWLRNRYEIKTFKDLAENEKTAGPFAQIVKYSGYKKNSTLGSEGFDLFRVCLQDDAVLKLIDADDRIQLAPLIIYVVTHELVHIVRFGQFEQFFHVHEAERKIEEGVVHGITQGILQQKKIAGMDVVLNYYKAAAQ